MSTLLLSSTQIDTQPPVVEFAIPQTNSYPLGVTTDTHGNVWFAEANTDLISEFFPSNHSFVDYEIPTQLHLAMIWYLIFDSNGYLWFADPVQPVIWRFSPSTRHFVNYTTGSSALTPYALAYDPNSNQIWFTSTYINRIGAFQIEPDESAEISASIELPTINGSNTGPSGIVLNAQGDVFVSESFAGRIAEYDPKVGNFLHIWNITTHAQPVGIAVDDSKNLIFFANHASSLFGFVNESDNQVVQISTSLYSYSSGTLISTTISLPYWMSITKSGQIWFDEHYANRIARYDPSTLRLDEFQVPTNNSQPLRFHIDEATGQLWFTEFSGNNLGVVDLNASAGKTIVSPQRISLSQGETSLEINVPLSQIEGSNISGSTSFDGFLSSNFSFAYTSLNSSASRVTIRRGSVLDSGNFSLTICSNNNQNLAKSCGIIFVDVENQPNSYELIFIAVIVIAAVLAFSLTYMKRWRC